MAWTSVLLHCLAMHPSLLHILLCSRVFSHGLFRETQRFLLYLHCFRPYCHCETKKNVPDNKWPTAEFRPIESSLSTTRNARINSRWNRISKLAKSLELEFYLIPWAMYHIYFTCPEVKMWLRFYSYFMRSKFCCETSFILVLPLLLFQQYEIRSLSSDAANTLFPEIMSSLVEIDFALSQVWMSHFQEDLSYKPWHLQRYIKFVSLFVPGFPSFYHKLYHYRKGISRDTPPAWSAYTVAQLSKCNERSYF